MPFLMANPMANADIFLKKWLFPQLKIAAYFPSNGVGLGKAVVGSNTTGYINFGTVENYFSLIIFQLLKIFFVVQHLSIFANYHWLAQLKLMYVHKQTVI